MTPPPTVGDEQLRAAYFRHVAVDDLRGHDGAQALALARAHAEAAAVRATGTAVVQVRPDGPRRTVVDVVTDDVPFLVDSVVAELTRQGRSVLLLLHPQLRVRRDGDGRLLAVGLARDALGAVPESWVHLELDGPDEHPEQLAVDLQRVLGDVRAAVEDWPAMTAAARSCARDLDDTADPDGDARELLTWLADDRFTFLGAARYRVEGEGEQAALVPVDGTDLGLLRAERRASSTARLAEEVRDRRPQGRPLVVTKAGTRSTVHRPAYLDDVGVQLLDPAGRVVGEQRFVGLFAAVAYTESVTRVPVVRRRVAALLERSGVTASSHTGRELLAVLETFPRDELFQTRTDELAEIVPAVVRLRERRQLRLFLRRDEHGRYLSVLVYLPRDRYTTSVRLALTEVLRDALRADSVEFTARVSESVLARLHFVVRGEPGQVLPDVDVPALEARLAAAARSWDDDLAEALQPLLGPRAADVLGVYGAAFPEAYKEDFPAGVGAEDVLRLVALEPDGPLATALYAGPGELPDQRRLKVYRDGPLSLSQVLPVLQSLGVDVLDERPYSLHCGDGRRRWVYDFGLRLPAGPGGTVLPGGDAGFAEAFAACWAGRDDVDPLNALVTLAGLDRRQVLVLRTYVRYLRQTSSTYSAEYVQSVLVAQVPLAVELVGLFAALFDPDAPAGREERAAEREAALVAGLDAVESLDADRILRALLALVLATDRTTHYQPGPDGQPHPYLALKLDPQRLPDLPRPRPVHEIWVYSPRVEGVHLRFGAVARGGLRWSDRREDFRTEVLGLVKAQVVKNAVIVPTGAKGGFVAKRLPDPATDREGWLAEGIACYRTFVGAMLDLTDDLLDGQVRPPERVVRRDGDDTYLVVAADKGTATFSDLANGLALERGFWLGDAFASGGSSGYDHKAMGITARGAWRSVDRHFRELGVDVSRDDVTVVGVGDMSGDVFGNGMLLSEHLRLVAAFDHRHVFLDPDPDPAVSFAERQRLFALPRSSWADYDPALVSPGGGVYPRTAKSVPVSPQVRAALGLPDDVVALSPAELVRAVLTAPVDLLWNGGIGTYVKASTETHAQAGDKANDALRVDGAQLRAKVVGEGGNLGLTQLGRIEYALLGGRVNTDAIDNSAGVDTSDHEVNIKILLQSVGDLPRDERDALLVAMTDEVAARVLRHNDDQNLALGTARHQAPSMLPVHARMLDALEASRELDRRLEHLPSPQVLAARAAEGRGLVGSELAVLLAYAKTTLTAALLDTGLPEDAWSARALRGYFPDELVRRYDERLDAHPLRRQIIVTSLVNDLVDHGGTTFVFRAVEETGATPAEVVRAWTVAREVFDLERLWADVGALDHVVPTRAQTLVHLETRRLLDRAVRWLLQTRRSAIDVQQEVEQLAGTVQALSPVLPDLLVGVEAERLVRRAGDLAEAGLPEALAQRTAALLDAFSLLDVADLSRAAGRDPREVAALYFTLSDRFEVDRLLTRISGLPRADRWQALARASLRYDLYAALAGLTSAVLRGAAPGTDPVQAVEAWEAANGEGLARARTTLAETLTVEPADLAALSVALRMVRSLLPG